MKITVLCCLNFLSLLSIFSTVSPPIFAKEVTCKVVARVISSSNSSYKFGTFLCAGRALNVSRQSPLDIACANAVLSFRAVSPSDLYLCPTSRYVTLPKPPESFRSLIRSTANQPVVVRPYGLNQRRLNSKLEWLPIKNANSYRIIVDDLGEYWFSLNSIDSQIKLPDLPSGTYQVLISALNNGIIIGETAITIAVLSPTKINQVSDLISNIEKLNDSPSQKIVYKLGVLSRFNLLEESITSLSQYLSSDKSNMFLTRTLGDLYLEAAQPIKAYQLYQKYEVLAQTNSSKDDLASAQERIQLVATVSDLLTP